MLYFKLLKRLAIIYLAMTILALPAMIYNTNGPDLKLESNYYLEKTTMGNLGQDPNTTVEGFDKRTMGVVTTFLDTLYCIIFLVFIVGMSAQRRKQARQLNENVQSVDDFTVMVTNIPPYPDDEKRSYRQDLKEFFEASWGPVVDVAIAYNDFTIIKMYMKRGELKEKWAAAKARKQQSEMATLDKKVAEIDVELKAAESTFDRRAKTAYVTFLNEADAHSCIDDYPDKWWFRGCCMPSRLRFHGHSIRVKRAPEPSNILFQNIEYGLLQKTGRRVLTVLLTIIAMSLSLGIIYAAQSAQRTVQPHGTCPLWKITLDDALALPRNETIVDCYCEELTYNQVYKQRDLCGTYVEQEAREKGLLFGSALAIVVVNNLIRLIIRGLSRFERHDSLSSEQTAIFGKLFYLLFVNTAIIVLVVNANFSVNGPGLSVLFNGQFNDFDSEWYTVVGISILLTMVINIVNPHAINVIRIPIAWLRRNSSTCRPSKLSQHEMNQLFSGPTFELAPRYAAILNTVFVTLFYSGGMPLLLPIGCVTFTVIYWFDKIAFLRLYRIPPRYDDTLEALTMSYLPYAVMLHAATSIWFYTGPISHSYFLNNNYVSTVSSVGGSPSVSVDTRLAQWNAFPLLLLFIALVVLKFLFSTLGRLLLKMLCIDLDKCATCKTSTEVQVEPKNYFQARDAGRVRFESYHISRLDTYRTAYLYTESRRQLPQEHIMMADPARAGGGGGGTGASPGHRVVPSQSTKDGFAALPQGDSGNPPRENIKKVLHKSPSSAQPPGLPPGSRVIDTACPHCFRPLQIVDRDREDVYTCKWCLQKFKA